MKVSVSKPSDISGPCEVYLEAENDRDSEILAALDSHYELVGMGCDPTTHLVRHARVRLSPKQPSQWIGSCPRRADGAQSVRES